MSPCLTDVFTCVLPGCSYAIFPFVWALPEYQNTINSLNMGMVSLSSALIFVGIGLYYLHVHLFVFFGLVSASTALGAVLCQMYVPSLQDTEILQAAFMFAQAAGEEGEGDTMMKAEEMEMPGWQERLRAWPGNLRAAMAAHPVANLLFITYNIVYFLFIMNIAVQSYFYYASIFDAQTAARMADMQGIVQGVGGAAFSIFMGIYADRVVRRITVSVAAHCHPP